MKPRYPIYVISKGRWESRLTVKSLDRLNVPYRVVVEPQEFEQYAKVIDPSKILTLPFSNLNRGSIPARNWVWEHSVKEGYERHWILDDNIEDFNRLNKNMKLRVRSGGMFAAAEDFVDRYYNVALAGFNYYSFCKASARVPAFYLNTRIYSCILIKNDITYKWRGMYNEDTDLSLRVLKDGWCTVLFNAFLCGKVTTLRMKGGNTDSIYQEDGVRKKAESLREQHPDVVKVVWKFNRWHHQVDYSPFKQNKLKLKEGVEIPEGCNNYNMKLVAFDKELRKCDNCKGTGYWVFEKTGEKIVCGCQGHRGEMSENS